MLRNLVFTTVFLPRALGCCRGDPKRTLVAVNASIHTVAELTGGWHGNVFDRDDFESVFTNRVEIWATRAHIEVLHRAGLRTAPTIDTAQLSFEAEKKAAYMDTPGEEPDWTQYCGYECMTSRLSDLASEGGCQFPFELVNIGQSVQGRTLWAAKIGNNAGPEVLLGGNIHGDEPVGNMVMQRWMWTTCNNPTSNMAEVATSIQGWYLPNLNPDGYEMNRRNNANNFDLNRNFPKPSGTPQTPQPETIAYMDFVRSHAFSITTHFHGGAVVCNTAYDNCYTEEIVPRPCPPALPTLHPRAEDVVPSSRAYCDPMMAAGVSCNVGVECQVNGAAWYQISGSEQDWVFHFMEGVAMTMEMTNTKRPGGHTLPGHYDNNEAAFHSFMMYPVRKALNVTISV